MKIFIHKKIHTWKDSYENFHTWKDSYMERFTHEKINTLKDLYMKRFIQEKIYKKISIYTHVKKQRRNEEDGTCIIDKVVF